MTFTKGPNTGPNIIEVSETLPSWVPEVSLSWIHREVVMFLSAILPYWPSCQGTSKEKTHFVEHYSSFPVIVADLGVEAAKNVLQNN